jgi:hypothetical protein
VITARCTGPNDMVQAKGSGRSIVRKMLAFESNPCENTA